MSGLMSFLTASDLTASSANRGHMTRTRILTLSVSVLALAHLGLAATGAEARVFVQDAPPAAATDPQAPAEAAPAPPQTAYVERITIQGNERIDSQTIISYLPFQTGATWMPP